MARLLDAFSPFFTLGLELATALEAGAPVPDATVVRKQARTRLDAAQHAARIDGHSARHIESACFAATAWFDEITRPLAGDGANGMSLHAALFNSRNAPTEFFHHLSALGPDEAEVREVYWYVLALGFRGQYHFEESDDGERGKLKALHGQQLPVPPLTVETLARERLTPQPYASPGPPARRRPQRRRRALVRAGGALALLLPSGYLASLMLGGLPTPPPVSTDPVAQQLQRYACAELSLSRGSDGSSRVSGFVASAEEVARVQQDVRALPDAPAPDFDLRIRAWPYCEVAAILKPYQMRNRDSKVGLQVTAPSARQDRLREGDAVRIQVTAPAYGSYLRVDYYTADGAVLHLMPRPVNLRLSARQTVTLGSDMPTSWLVSPPFGTVLVAAVASPMPFDDPVDRPPYELASSYLAALRQALAVNPGGPRLVADFLFLETVAR